MNIVTAFTHRQTEVIIDSNVINGKLINVQYYTLRDGQYSEPSQAIVRTYCKHTVMKAINCMLELYGAQTLNDVTVLETSVGK